MAGGLLLAGAAAVLSTRLSLSELPVAFSGVILLPWHLQKSVVICRPHVGSMRCLSRNLVCIVPVYAESSHAKGHVLTHAVSCAGHTSHLDRAAGPLS